jgi:alkylated DNA repair dioxygenase AlkB
VLDDQDSGIFYQYSSRLMSAPRGFRYEPLFLGAPEQQGLLDKIAGLEYTHDRFRGRALRRSYVQYGFAYITAGRQLTSALPIPEFAQSLINHVRRAIPDTPAFNRCIVTKYPAGAGIGWHTDAPQFGDCLVAVSLAAPAMLEFRGVGAAHATYSLVLAPGSLYLCRGAARWHYQHRVLPVKGARYSITLRTVAQHQNASAGHPAIH